MPETADATAQIDALIAELADWRGETLADIRRAILEADPEIVEEWKWRGSPVWSRAGNLCVGNAFKDKVKLTFPDGASLPDPAGLFNNGLTGNKWRTIDYHEGDPVRENDLMDMVRAAVAFNEAKPKTKGRTKTASR